MASTYFSNSIGVEYLSSKRKGWGEFKYTFHYMRWIYEIIFKIQAYNFEHIVRICLETLFHNKSINWWKLSHFKILRWKNLSLVSIVMVDYFLFFYAQTLDNLHFFEEKEVHQKLKSQDIYNFKFVVHIEKLKYSWK